MRQAQGKPNPPRRRTFYVQARGCRGYGGGEGEIIVKQKVRIFGGESYTPVQN
jgi:hypothetical protein